MPNQTKADQLWFDLAFKAGHLWHSIHLGIKPFSKSNLIPNQTFFRPAFTRAGSHETSQRQAQRRKQRIIQRQEPAAGLVSTLWRTLCYKLKVTCLCRSLFPCQKGPEKPSLYDFKVKERKAIIKTNLTFLLFMLSCLNVVKLT